MKKSIFILVLFVVQIISSKLFCQSAPFDVVRDQFGNKFPISSLNVNSTRPIGGPYSVNTLPTNSCTAGYFTLWFAQGSYCDTHTLAAATMCNLFSDISGLLSYSNSPLSALSNTLRVNILCADYTGTANVAAFGGGFYVCPNNPSNPYPGVIQNQAQKLIISGADPYLNIPVTFFNSGAFYHGTIYTNPNSSWNLGTGATTIAPGDIDFYGNHLHEAMHILGILSLIDNTGYSTLGQTNNYFGLYDKFLVDNLGNHLISSSTATSCPNNNVSFNSSLLSSIAPATTSCITDVSTCSTAIQYSSAAAHMTVYTPNCWEPGSSLSHLEDQCLGSGLVSTSCYTANGSSDNNIYYVMANRTYTGSCYIKRYLKEDERKVLCDLGYSVAATYTSNVAVDGTLTSHSYTAGACSPTAIIVGLNDGLVNGAYIYTTTGTSTVISFSTLLANDLPASGLTVSCVELVYSTPASLTVGLSNFTVSAPLSSGLVLIKYTPKNASGQFGNPTYVYVYFIPSNCNVSGMCNLVQNGGFETAQSCGLIAPFTSTYASCWVPVNGLNYLYSQGCTSGSVYNLGSNNTLGTPNGTPLTSYSGSGNNNVIGLNWTNFISYANSQGVMKNNLSAPIVPTNTYQVSLFANNYLNAAANNTSAVVISIATSSVYAFVPNGSFPNGLDVIAEFTVYPGTNWSQLTHTFVFTPSVSTNHYALLVGLNQVKTLALPGTSWNPSASSNYNPSNGIFCFIDDVSLSKFPVPTFSIPSPTICGSQSFTNLAQYISPATTGTFSGLGVTTSTTGQSNFNLNLFMQPGVYQLHLRIVAALTPAQMSFIKWLQLAPIPTT